MNRYGHSLRTLFGRGWWMGCLIQGFESTAPWIVWPGTFSKRRAACRAPRGCLGMPGPVQPVQQEGIPSGND